MTTPSSRPRPEPPADTGVDGRHGTGPGSPEASREAALEVAPSGLHGRGVFARRAFTVGQLIERCPILLVPPDQVARLDRTTLYDYYFDWDARAAAIALGYGSLYNHDTVPNARYHKDFSAGVVDIIAIRQIGPDDEITVDYTRGGTNPLWFTPSSA